jgi:hypothetical protein
MFLQNDIPGEAPAVDMEELRQNYIRRQKEYLHKSEEFEAVSDLHSRIMQVTRSHASFVY